MACESSGRNVDDRQRDDAGLAVRDRAHAIEIIIVEAFERLAEEGSREACQGIGFRIAKDLPKRQLLLQRRQRIAREDIVDHEVRIVHSPRNADCSEQRIKPLERELVELRTTNFASDS